MSTLELRPGSKLWLDGEVWSVEELPGKTVRLRQGTTFRNIPLATLASEGRLMTGADPNLSPEDGDWELANVVLGELSVTQTLELESRAKLVRELLRGASSSLSADIPLAAEKAGVSVRTVERWISGYRRAGVAGLADKRLLRTRRSGVDPRWDAACIQVLDQHVNASTPTVGVLIDRVQQQLEKTFGPDEVPCPSRSTAFRRIKLIAKGRHSFGSAKQRRSVAQRPEGPYGRLRATRPGEYVVLDTTPLDVFAMEPVTLRWVPVELTVAQDLFTRCILGLRLSPVSTNSSDVANVLYQCVTPMPDGDSDGAWPFHGVPRNVLVGTETPDGVSQERLEGLPACLPESIVIDHGRVYMSDHIISACARLGISVQPGLPYKPTDKPTVERFFKTLREGLLQHLPGYKGPDIFSRGKDVETQAFYYLAELEQIIREWVGQVYHQTKHRGLCVAEVPNAALSPAEMFEIGVAKSGSLLLPTSADLAFSFLAVEWRTIQHYGVEIQGRRYDGPALNLHRGSQSPHPGPHRGKWPIFVDAHDVRRVWFRNPDTEKFEPLEWEHAPGLNQPFSREAAEYTKKVALRTHRHVDPAQAVRSLLLSWSEETVTSRREKSLARRLSAARAPSLPEDEESAPRERAGSTSGVLDFASARDKRRADERGDDIEEFFSEFFATHPHGQVEAID